MTEPITIADARDLIALKAGRLFWRLCEQLGNRDAALDAPLDLHTLSTIKRLVDAADNWNGFNAMPKLEGKYRQLSLWDAEDES